MHHAKNVLIIPPQDAQRRWDDAKLQTPQELSDMKGPKGDELRLPMPVEDYIDGASVVEQSKELNFENKRKKIGDAAEVAAAQQNLSQGMQASLMHCSTKSEEVPHTSWHKQEVP